jgi:RNA polymerase sigma factor (sigma-70 family)
MHSPDVHTADVRGILTGLIHQYGPRWLCFVRSILGNRADAEDVLQEAVRRLLARSRPLHSEDQVRMYLGRVIGNAAIDLYHSRRRERVRRMPLHDGLCLTAAESDPHGYMEQAENSVRQDRLVQLVREGLGKLPVKQYEALRLTVLESGATSIRDAGAVNGIPYSTLRHRTIQGLRMLRRFVRRTMRSERKW